MNLGVASRYEFYFPPLESWFEQRLYPTSFGISQFSVEINERKSKEQERDRLLDELRESREGLEWAQQIAHLGSWELDLVTDRLTWSDEVYRIFGLEPQEFGATYEAFLEHVHPDDREAADAAYSGSLREDRDGYEIEHRVVRKCTGEIRYVHERCQHVRDAAGKIVRSLGMVHDITERKQREARLAALKEIADAASSSLHLDAVASRVVDSVYRLLAAQQVQIRLVSEDREFLDIVASVGFSELMLARLERVSVDADLETALCFRTKTPRIGEDVRALRVTKASRQNAREAGVGSYVLLPLMEGSEAVGTFYVAWAEPRRFSSAELSFLQALSAQLVSGLVHARLFDEQQQAQRQAAAELERTKLLQDVTTAATGSLSLDEIGRRVLALSLETLGASGGAIYTTDEAKGQLRALALAGYPEDHESRIRLVPLNDQFTIGLLVTHDLPLVTHESGAGPASTGFAGRLLEEGMRWFALPIKRGEAVLGVFGLQFQGLRRFEEAELSLYRSIAVLLGEALQNARLYEAQRDIATTLQQSFRHLFPRPAGFDVGLVEAPAWQPALIGGDFWDLFELPDKRVVAIIGDVAGKGVQAAALTETVRSTMRAFAHIDAQPSFILRKTNEVILARGDDLMVTSLVMVVDAERGNVSLASAGHPGPIRMTPRACAIIDPAYGPPLGAFETEYSATKLPVARDDCLVLYTDGVTEARRNGELFGERRLVDTLRGCPGSSAQELADAVLAACHSFAGKLQDNLQVMALRLI
jgi:PAS domain S-box-containing protein